MGKRDAEHEGTSGKSPNPGGHIHSSQAPPAKVEMTLESQVHLNKGAPLQVPCPLHSMLSTRLSAVWVARRKRQEGQTLSYRVLTMTGPQGSTPESLIHALGQVAVPPLNAAL